MILDIHQVEKVAFRLAQGSLIRLRERMGERFLGGTP